MIKRDQNLQHHLRQTFRFTRALPLNMSVAIITWLRCSCVCARTHARSSLSQARAWLPPSGVGGKRINYENYEQKRTVCALGGTSAGGGGAKRTVNRCAHCDGVPLRHVPTECPAKSCCASRQMDTVIGSDAFAFCQPTHKRARRTSPHEKSFGNVPGSGLPNSPQQARLVADGKRLQLSGGRDFASKTSASTRQCSSALTTIDVGCVRVGRRRNLSRSKCFGVCPGVAEN